MVEICELMELPKVVCAHCRSKGWDEDQKQYEKVEKPLTLEGLKKGTK